MAEQSCMEAPITASLVAQWSFGQRESIGGIATPIDNNNNNND